MSAWLAMAKETEELLQLVLLVPLAAVACLGIGAASLVVRIILPGVAAATDRSLARMGTGRLFVMGVLPIVGAGLLARGVELAGQPWVSGLFLLLVGIPLVLAWMGGFTAGVLHIGTRVLRRDADVAPLRRASLGGLVVGLALVSWIVPPLGMVVTVLLSAWFVGIGLGALIRRRDPTEDKV